MVDAAKVVAQRGRHPMTAFDPAHPSRVWRAGTARARGAPGLASALSRTAIAAELPIRRHRRAVVAVSAPASKAERPVVGAGWGSSLVSAQVPPEVQAWDFLPMLAQPAQVVQASGFLRTLVQQARVVRVMESSPT